MAHYNTPEQIRVDNCKSLDELCATLNEIGEIEPEIDFSGLPLFSKNDPRDVREVFSYDDTRYLAIGGNNRWEIFNRCKCGEALFHCRCGHSGS